MISSSSLSLSSYGCHNRRQRQLQRQRQLASTSGGGLVITMLLTILSLIHISPTFSFLLQHPSTSSSSSSYYRSSLIFSSTTSTSTSNLTPLPKDISPFDKSASVGCDVQGELRKLATLAIQRALLPLDDDDTTSNKRRPTLLELEFPPLLGGSKSKTQFDDFDNVQELEANRDWCVEWLPTLAQSFNTQLFIKEEGDDEVEEDEKNEKKIWFILPDTKEVELCKEDWKGQRYRNSALFTSIEAVTEYYFSSSTSTSNNSNNSNNNKDNNNNNDGYSKPWGSTIANFANQLVKGNKDKDDNNNNDGKDENSPSSLIPSSGLLGDENSLDTLTSKEAAALHVVCQPGNGGPVEDWINVKKFHEKCTNDNVDNVDVVVPTIIVNGALDKVRDGYYASFIFPKLAKTFDFYKSFEPILYLKPITDKGLYGWIFKVYNEPYQIYLQRPITTTTAPKSIDSKAYNNDGTTTTTPTTTTITVEDILALVSDTKPTYQECIQALLKCNANANASR